ncbi:putative aminoacrylate hydrolase RutD [Peptococcaceae bacterium CEB3]|nr:putative aminoacrylate hydrolase RutD [Peptococcaceae bacterium CEB3]
MKIRIKNNNVTLPITRTGDGQAIIFFNGLGSTQATWNKVISVLKGKYEIITFDFRGHGLASAAQDYSFDTFFSDAESVLKVVDVERPIIVAWSLGADIAVSYAATHPGKIGGIVIVDGADPVPEPLIENLDDTRKSLNKLSVKIGMLLLKLSPYGYKLSSNEFVDVVAEVDAHRSRLMNLYRKVDCPITMIMASKSMGEKDAHSRRTNRLWQEGIDQLTKVIPSISVQWIDDSHQLPFKHPVEIAQTIDNFAIRIKP